MIELTCPTCNASYTVADDRAGKRTRCARCRTPLAVPPAEPAHAPRPPAKVVVALVGMFLGGLALIALAAYLVTPAPTRESVERRLREELPPGYENLKVESFDPDTRRLQFAVRYREPGHILETDYAVVRYKTGAGWRVQVSGRRPRWDDPVIRPVMVESVFDSRGRIVERGVDAAGPGEAAVFERRARDIARAVHEVF